MAIELYVVIAQFAFSNFHDTEQVKHSYLSAYRPGAQGLQTVTPALDMYPASHALHVKVPNKDVRPAWEVEHEVLPAFDLYKPPAVQLFGKLLPMN